MKLVEFLEIDSSNCEAHNLCLGAEYLVVAMAFGPWAIWLFLEDRFRGLQYPLIYPASLFTITQTNISRFWENGLWCDRIGNEHSFLAPPEWVADPLFHARLFEGDHQTQSLYGELLMKLSLEHSLPWVRDTAISLEEGCWVSDNDFDNQWEVDKTFAMTVHPKTKELLHNPLYLPK